MHFHILTLFPEMVSDGLNTSIIGRAVKAGYLTVDAVNIRDFAFNKHQSVDDYPYGGGAGMLMQAEPIYLAHVSVCEKIARRRQQEALEAERQIPDEVGAESKAGAACEAGAAKVELQIPCEAGEENEAAGRTDIVPGTEEAAEPGKIRTVYLSPKGKVFTQEMAQEMAKEEDLILLCGHYEGIDERVLEEIVTDEVSIGDYVLTGGELPAMVMVDAISRLVPGVLHNDVSAQFETFHDNLLEYPQYTRPEEWHGKKVPEVLLSGHHANVEKWRREQAILKTAENRPDLLAQCELTQRERQWLEKETKAAK